VGRLAAGARPGRLVLTHLYPATERLDVKKLVRARFKGQVALAADGDRFELGR